MIINFALFVLFLLTENLLLPALIGTTANFIIPLFAVFVVLYTESRVFGLMQAMIFMVIGEFFSGTDIGSTVVPFIIVVAILVWINNYLNIRSLLKESDFLPSTIAALIVVGLVIYGYFYAFLIMALSFDPFQAVYEFIVLFRVSYLQVIIWSMSFNILFKYVLKTK